MRHPRDYGKLQRRIIDFYRLTLSSSVIPAPLVIPAKAGTQLLWSADAPVCPLIEDGFLPPQERRAKAHPPTPPLDKLRVTCIRTPPRAEGIRWVR